MKIKRKKTIFLGCEGASEIGFGAMLNTLLSEAGVDRVITNYDAGGSSAKTIIERSIDERMKLRRLKGDFFKSWIFLDNDNWCGEKRNLQRLCRHEGINLLVSHDTFEAELGRIISGNVSYGSARAEKVLLKVWKDYNKPQDKISLLKWKDQISLGLAAISKKSDDWKLFLTDLKLL